MIFIYWLGIGENAFNGNTSRTRQREGREGRERDGLIVTPLSQQIE